MAKSKTNEVANATNTNATYTTMQSIVDAYPEAKQVFYYEKDRYGNHAATCYTLSETEIPANADEYSKRTFNRVQKYEQEFRSTNKRSLCNRKPIIS